MIMTTSTCERVSTLSKSLSTSPSWFLNININNKKVKVTSKEGVRSLPRRLLRPMWGEDRPLPYFHFSFCFLYFYDTHNIQCIGVRSENKVFEFCFEPFCVPNKHKQTSKQKLPEPLKWWSHQELGVGGNFQDCPTQGCPGSPGEYTDLLLWFGNISTLDLLLQDRILSFCKYLWWQSHPAQAWCHQCPKSPRLQNGSEIFVELCHSSMIIIFFIRAKKQL